MTLPRPVEPGSFYFITRRCTQRQFLLRPDDETNNAYAYCLADAAQRFHMDVLTTFCSTNHHHTVIYDREGNHPGFIEHFHKMLARCMNVHRNRVECFWSSSPVCVTKLLDRAAVIDKIVYTITNAVKDQLVEKVHQWPGINGYSFLRSGKAMTAKRPRFFFRADGKMPEEVSLTFTIPIELDLTAAELLEILERRIAKVEAEAAEERAFTGRRVFGRANVLKIRFNERPSSRESRTNLRPRFACRDRATRTAALAHYSAFLRAYREARAEMLVNKPTTFPPGTYWLHHFAAVKIAVAHG